MDLLLIDPVTTARSLSVGERKKLRQGIGYPALGLLTVAALTPPDVNVRVIDESVEDIDFGLSPDLVGITVQCPVAPYAYELASIYRRRGIPVILGGVHVSLNQEEALHNADAIVTGEAELTWPTLVDDFRKRRMKRVYAAQSLADLDASPRPRRELITSENYQIPFVVQASKGCPYGCEFCSLHCYLGYQPRFRKVENVLCEIREMPGDRVLFADDNLYANPGYTKALLSGLVSLKKRWVGEATWNIAFDPEILTLARASGCVGLFMGFDSINQQINIRKVPVHDAETTYVKAIQNVQSAGLAVVAAFVFGLDNDNTSVFERSLSVALNGGANLVNFSALVPYPGTPIFRRLKSEGRITEWDWSKYISPNVCFTPKRMSAQDLYDGTAWAQREFYSLRNIVKISLKAFSKMGWAMSLLSMRLNLAQKRDWGKGSSGE